jgi:hypothetical protein
LWLRLAIERVDLLIDLLRKLQVTIDIAGPGILGIRTDRKILLLHPFENSLPFGRIVAALFDLIHERSRLLFVTVGALRQERNYFIGGGKSARHHCKYKASVVADVLTGLKRIHQVSHHSVFA